MSTNAEEGRVNRWAVLLLLMGLCFISHLNRVGMSVVGTERLRSTLGITEAQLGTVYSSFLLFYTLFMIAGGQFIDRFGARSALTLMGFATAFFGVCTGLVGLLQLGPTGTWLGLILVRSMMGICTTPLHPGCARAVGDIFAERQRTWANSLVTGAALLGIAVSYKVVGELIDAHDWPIALIITSGTIGLVTVLWMIVSRGLDNVSAKPPKTDASSLALLRQPGVIWLTLSYAAIGYFQYLFFYWLQFYFDEVMKVGVEKSRLYAGLPTFAMAAGMPLGGLLALPFQRKFGPNRGLALLAIGGMLLSAVFLVSGLFVREIGAVVTLFTLSLGVLGFSEGSFWTRAVEMGGTRGGTTAAIMNTGGNGIGLLAPQLTPILGAWLGWKLGLGFGAVILLLGAACWLGVEQKPRSRGSASQAA